MDEPGSTARQPRWPVVVVWLVAGCVLSLRYPRPAWSADEAATVVVVRSDWADTWRMSVADAGIGAYYLILKPWATFSTSHAWLRLPSLLAAATTIAVVFVFVRGVVGTRPATFTAGLLVVVPSLARYAGDARPYALAALGGAWAVRCWWRYLDSGRLVSAAGMVVGLVVAGLAHSYALLICVPLLVGAVAVPLHGRRHSLLRTAVPIAVALGVIAPWLWHVLQRAHGTPTPRIVTMRSLLNTPVWLWRTSGADGEIVLMATTACVLAAAGCVIGWRAGGAARRLAVLAAAWWIAPPLLLALWQTLTDKSAYVPRYWFCSLPAVAIAAGLALDRMARRHVAAAVSVTVALAILTLPSHRALGRVDAHGGRLYLDLVAVLELPPLQSAPLLVWGPQYRGVVANRPGLAGRVPIMVGSPGRPLDLVHPRPDAPEPSHWRLMAQTYPTVVALRATVVPRARGTVVTAGQLRGQRGGLKVYRSPDVLCVFHGELLGVFSRSPTTMAPRERVTLAEMIQAVNPSRISCRPVVQPPARAGAWGAAGPPP